MNRQLLLVALFLFPTFSWSENQIHNAIQCSDISTQLHLEVWVSQNEQGYRFMTTYEKLSDFATKCEIRFSDLEEWHNYRDFHLKSLEGE